MLAMHRRLLVIIALIFAASWLYANAAHAAEAATPQVGELIVGLGEQERARVADRLRRENFSLVGDARRKGELFVATAVQQGVPWRLVIDARTGEIIGRRPLAESVALPR
jgi:hypothetical protein